MHGWYEAGMEGFGLYGPRSPGVAGQTSDPDGIRRRSGSRLRFFGTCLFDFLVDWENTFHQSHLKQISERPFIAGAAVWNMFDFGSENRRDAVPRINNKGLCGFNRQP